MTHIKAVSVWKLAYFIISEDGIHGIPMLRISYMLAFATSSVAAEQQSVTTVVS